MTVVLDPALEQALSAQAKQQGLAPQELALDALRQRFLPPRPRTQPQDDCERRLAAAASNCGVSLSNEAVSSEGIYE